MICSYKGWGASNTPSYFLYWRKQMGMASNFKDLTGQRFGRLTAQWPVGKSPSGNGGVVRWLCMCDCGNLLTVVSSSLTMGRGKSCGCLSRDRARETNTTHGKSNAPEGRLLYAAAKRARAANPPLPFNLTVEDIVIPETCPLLEIPLRKTRKGSGKGPCTNSPTLDRIIPRLGYVKGNVQVISHRANAMKQDASLEECELLAKNWRRQCQ